MASKEFSWEAKVLHWYWRLRASNLLRMVKMASMMLSICWDWILQLPRYQL